MSTASEQAPPEPIEPFPGEVIKMWRENKTLGEIAAKLEMGVPSVYRLLVLTGEMRRSIELGLEEESRQSCKPTE